MVKKLYLIFLCVSFLLSAEADHILLSRITIQPDEAEMVAIFNPTNSEVDLSNYYLSDAETSTSHYYNIPTGDNYWTNSQFDFIVRFPDITIGPQETMYIALHSKNEFYSYYGFEPELSLQEDMLDAIDGVATISTQSDILGSYESLILFFWDQSSPIVKDVDYFYWGFSAALPNFGGIDKTNVDIDNDGTLDYFPDTDFITQAAHIYTAPHEEGYTFLRNSSEEEDEFSQGGNGITGHDETSENFLQSWSEVTHPEHVPGCIIPTDPNFNPDATEDDGSCLTTHSLQDIITGNVLDEDGNPITCNPDQEDCFDVTVFGRITAFDNDVADGVLDAFTLLDTDLIDGGYKIEVLTFDWEMDVVSESQGYLGMDGVTTYKNIFSSSMEHEYYVLVSGSVGRYGEKFQIDISVGGSGNIIVYSMSDLGSGITVLDPSIIKVEIIPAPYVIIPTLNEKLDYSYSFPSDSRVTIRIFDLDGKLVTSLVDKHYTDAGTVFRIEGQSEWDGRNHLGQIVPPGTYLMHIEATNWKTGKSSTDIAPIVVGVYK